MLIYLDPPKKNTLGISAESQIAYQQSNLQDL